MAGEPCPPLDTEGQKGLWVEVGFGACGSTPIVAISPCPLTLGEYSRRRVQGGAGITAASACPVCGATKPILSPNAAALLAAPPPDAHTSGETPKKRRKRLGNAATETSVTSVFIPMHPRAPTKRPYSRLSPDHLTAILAVPTYLLRHGTEGDVSAQSIAHHAFAAARIDFDQDLIVQAAVSRLLAFCAPDSVLSDNKAAGEGPGGSAVMVTDERWPSLLQLPTALILIAMRPDAAHLLHPLDISVLKQATLAECSRRATLAQSIAARAFPGGEPLPLMPHLDPLLQAFAVGEWMLQKGLHTPCFPWESGAFLAVLDVPRNPLSTPQRQAECSDFHALLLRCITVAQVSDVVSRHFTPAFDTLMEDARMLQPQGLDAPICAPFNREELAMLPQGFRYVGGVLRGADEDTGLINLISESLQAGSVEGMLRRVAHYGFNFRYPADGIDVDNPHEGGMPEWTCGLAGLLEEVLGIRAGVLSQMTANEYCPGQGISPHYDDFATIGEPLVTLSLGSPIAMALQNPRTGFKVEVILEAGSVALFTGDSRYDWTHGIPKRLHDPSPSGTGLVKRQKRVSATFRNVPPVHDWMAAPLEEVA